MWEADHEQALVGSMAFHVTSPKPCYIEVADVNGEELGYESNATSIELTTSSTVRSWGTHKLSRQIIYMQHMRSHGLQSWPEGVQCLHEVITMSVQAGGHQQLVGQASRLKKKSEKGL